MQAPADVDFVRYVAARQQAFLRAAYLVCGDRGLAEDLVQEAFVKLATRWDRVRGDNPDAYVRRILYHDAVSTWRRNRREVLVADLPERGGVAGGDAVTARLDLLRTLATLTAKQRAVVVLRFFEDRSVAETAAALGVSEGTVKSQTYAALARLREVVPDLVSTEEDR